MNELSFVINGTMWSWMCVGVLLMLAELFIPGSFMVWFGFGAVLTGLVVGIAGTLSTAMQIFIFVVMSVISLIFGFFVYRKIFGHNKDIIKDIKTGAARFIGNTYTVSQAIKNGKGKVLVGDTVWLAKAKKDIAKDKEVIVVGVDGTQLLVEEK